LSCFQDAMGFVTMKSLFPAASCHMCAMLSNIFLLSCHKFAHILIWMVLEMQRCFEFSMVCWWIL